MLEWNGNLFPEAERARILAGPSVNGKLGELFALGMPDSQGGVRIVTGFVQI